MGYRLNVVGDIFPQELFANVVSRLHHISLPYKHSKKSLIFFNSCSPNIPQLTTHILHAAINIVIKRNFVLQSKSSFNKIVCISAVILFGLHKMTEIPIRFLSHQCAINPAKTRREKRLCYAYKTVHAVFHILHLR